MENYSFKLKVTGPKIVVLDEVFDLVEHFKNKINKEAGYSYISSDCDGYWYDKDKVMLEFSKKYPDYVFQIKDEGAYDTEVWNKVTWYQNGKMYTQQLLEMVVHEEQPFDQTKLN